MPIKDKIELLTPEERKEWEKLEEIRWSDDRNLSEEEQRKWWSLRSVLKEERILNMTPEELEELEAHDKALEAKAKYMEEHGVTFY